MTIIYEDLVVELGDPTTVSARERAEASWGCCQVYEGNTE